MKSSEIKFTITLDDNKNPEAIHWQAQDSGMEGIKESKALMVSLWDKKDAHTMRIDLWTKEMMVEEMHHFYYEMLMSMADTYQNATNDAKNATELRVFAKKFGQAVSVVK
jgi:gliding motility-associated protein GldC